jgi:serine/threonine protein phosphatase PrpC
MRFHGMSDTGLKRTENEDRYYIGDAKGYCILADGMGGRLYGEVASSMAVEVLTTRIESQLPQSLGRLERSEQAAMVVNLLDEWIRDANRIIFERGQQDDRYQEMGTTLLVLFVLDRQIVLAHVGDSRAYRFRGGEITQLTEDHSFVNSQVKSGVLTEEEAARSHQKNIITRALGTAAKVKPDIQVLPFQPGDLFLLCSDGLSDMVPPVRMAEILGKGTSMKEIARELIAAANDAGGRDNITVVLGHVQD